MLFLNQGRPWESFSSRFSSGGFTQHLPGKTPAITKMMHFSPPPRTVGTVKGGGGVTTFPTLQRTSPMKSFGNHIRFTGNLANCTTSGAKTVNLGKGFCCRQSSSHKQRKKKTHSGTTFATHFFPQPKQHSLPIRTGPTTLTSRSHRFDGPRRTTFSPEPHTRNAKIPAKFPFFPL